MNSYFKVLFISAVLSLTAACQDTLDTSSDLAKEQSIKQMMVGIYPQNQKIFKQALKTIYDADVNYHTDLSQEDVLALTDKKLKGKTVEDILRISFISKKLKTKQIETAIDSVVAIKIKKPKTQTLVKVAFKTK